MVDLVTYTENEEYCIMMREYPTFLDYYLYKENDMWILSDYFGSEKDILKANDCKNAKIEALKLLLDDKIPQIIKKNKNEILKEKEDGVKEILQYQLSLYEEYQKEITEIYWKMLNNK